MSTSRRRTRRPDPLASPEAVRRLLEQLRRQCPEVLPRGERQVSRMLESVRHHERRPATEEGRGRPRRWPRADVAAVAVKLRKLLGREAGGRVSPSSFVSLYLPILRYPSDIGAALGAGEINVREAAYLARLTSERLNCVPQQARQLRGELMRAHLLANGSQSSLRLRVKAALGETVGSEPTPGKSGRQKADELIRKNPYDPRHLFYDEVQRLVETMNEIGPEDLKGESLGELLRQIDKLLNMLRRAKAKPARRGMKVKRHA